MFPTSYFVLFMHYVHNHENSRCPFKLHLEHSWALFEAEVYKKIMQLKFLSSCVIVQFLFLFQSIIYYLIIDIIIILLFILFWMVRDHGGRLKAKGIIYLSNIRMVFVAKNPVGGLIAFDMPLVCVTILLLFQIVCRLSLLICLSCFCCAKTI